jgi:uncharacterized membrane protein
MTEKTRAYIYRIVIAASPIVVFYGLATAEETALWVALIANALGVALAVANTSTEAPGDD